MTSRNEISEWFDQGVAKGATHMAVFCDTFDYEDYPSYVMPNENAREKISKKTGEWARLMEVYNLRKDKQEQLNQFRVFNYD